MMPIKQNWGLKVTPYYTYVEDYINARALRGSR